MDSNVAVLLVMIVLMVGGAIFLNFQIKHQEKKDRMQAKEQAAQSSKAMPSSQPATQH